MNAPLRLALAVTVLAVAAASAGPPAEPGPFRAVDLVDVAALDATIRLDVRYARADNLLGRPVYEVARVFLQRPAAEAVVRAHRALLTHGYGLMLFDGYRPWSVTKAFWDATPADRKAYVADPAKGSRHNRGGAVDLTLYELSSGRAMTMPSAYDDFSERSHVTYEGGTAETRARRDLLIEAMERAGFSVYPWEWWHFDFKDWREYPLLDVPLVELAARPRMAPVPAIEMARARFVDLTHTFDESTLYWPTSPAGFARESLHHGAAPAGFFYSSGAISAPEHGGTHLDAPNHFYAGRWTTDEIPPEWLILPAYVIDVAAEAAADPDYRLTTARLAAWEAAHGRIPPGSAVLLRTGWSKRWPDRLRIFGSDEPGNASNLHFPAFGAEAARVLVDERSVRLLGLDTPSLDHGPSSDFPVHILSGAANVPGLENLARLDELPEVGAFVVALPMKIGGGSGGPLRAVGMLPTP